MASTAPTIAGVQNKGSKTNGINAKSVHLKVFIDKKKEKVMFAEADQDFVDILFSFLTLPLGTIARLSGKHIDSSYIKIGSLSSLYESALNLDAVLTQVLFSKERLSNPINASSDLCRKLRLDLNDTYARVTGSHGEAVLVKKKGSFIIMDDLEVKPFLLDRYMDLRKTIANENIELLERSMDFGFEEFLNLLRWSLLSSNPLTNLVTGGSKLYRSSSNIGNATKPYRSLSYMRNAIVNSSRPALGFSGYPQMVKILVHKSTKKVLCAQVDNFFIELLLSFLTVPLGAVKRLTMDCLPSLGIDNLYKSVSNFGAEKCLKSKAIKTALLRPKIASAYPRVTGYLPLYRSDTIFGHFINEKATFTVSDDLKIELSPSFATITNLTFGHPVGDIEVLDVSIGEPEALLILKASLTSASPLTDCLHAFKKK
ncbi:hypothetical protein CTI12_AA205290 [Artemisia annua]|uniref:DUF674 family protein n=1 Tax=Artemisia annua TaxID=35608 RepID=A0A2U1P179_ARTAN|nr:hypothetical protein CTI12_AA205290 [Artemisia annua]